MSTQGSRVVGAALFLVFGVSQAGAEIRFEDVSSAAGIDKEGETYGASWGDLDGDGYPDLYVSMHRTPVSLFLNAGDGSFVDVGSQTLSFITKPNADTHGGSWFDFDNDGDQDLFVTLGRGNPEMFLENERGMLIDRAAPFGTDTIVRPDGTTDRALVEVDPLWEGRLPIWLDYDNDGLPDFILAHGAGVLPLMRQVPDGTFVPANGTAGVACRPGQYSQFLDVTGDGSIELICHDGPSMTYPHRIWQITPERWNMLTNGGDEIMPQIEVAADTVLADFDNDGQVDIFLLAGSQVRPSNANLSADGRIEARVMGGVKGFHFANNGEVTFNLHQVGYQSGAVYYGANNVRVPRGESRSEVTITLRPKDAIGKPRDTGETPILRIWYEPEFQRWWVEQRARLGEGEGGGGDSVWAETYFLISSDSPITDLRTTGLWDSDGPARPVLLMNRTREGLGFVDEAAAWGLDEPVQCGSATAGDFNNDMHVDIYLACRTATSNIANVLYENRGNRTFARVADAGGAEGDVGLAVGDGVGTADSVVSADFDVDGFLDLFVTNGLNMFPEFVGGRNALFRNAGNGNNWVQVDLEGTTSHREAHGSVVTATAAGVEQTRVKNGSYHRWSHDHTRIHFGLAQAERVDLRVVWPGGAVDLHPGLPVNRVYRVIEGGGIQVVTPGEGLPYPCGLPRAFVESSGEELNRAVGRGVFISRECWNGIWQMRATRGTQGDLAVSGEITSTESFREIRVRNVLEGDSLLCDGVTCVTDGSGRVTSPQGVRRITYDFRVSGGFRGFDFLPTRGAETCFSTLPSSGTPVLMGILAKPVPRQFELDSLGECPSVLDPPDVGDDDGAGGDDDGAGGDDDGTGGDDDGTGGDDDGAGGDDDGAGGDDDGAGGDDDGAGGDDDGAGGDDDGAGGDDDGAGGDDDGAGGDGDDSGNDPQGGGDGLAGTNDGGSGALGFAALLAMSIALVRRRAAPGLTSRGGTPASPSAV